MLDNSFVRRVGAWHDPGVTTSLYLDVDGARFPRWPEVAQRVTHLFRLARNAPEAAVAKDGQGVEADLDAIAAWLDRDLDRTATRGVALFSCAAAGRFEAVEMPVPVRDQVVVDSAPDIAQLCMVLATSWSAIAVAVDRQRWRLVLIESDDGVRELDVLDDDIPRNVDTDVELAGFGRHEEELVREHYRRVARRITAQSARQPAARIVLLGSHESLAELESYLPRDVLGRVAGRTRLEMTVGTAELVAAARPIVERAEHERRSAVVEELAERADTGTLAVSGLDATLRALGDELVTTLVVERTFQSPGGRCGACHLLVAGEHLGACARCGGQVQAIPSVVDAAVSDAYKHGVRLEPVEDGALASLGHIGALTARTTDTRRREPAGA